MIEVYAFVAAFTVQILVMSVLQPTLFIRYWRAQAASIPSERLAQLHPGVDLERGRERFLTRYRALSTGIAVLGLLLLGWLFTYMRRPDWVDGPVEALVSVYFLVQALPLASIVWIAIKFNKVLQRPPRQGRRKAVLERRGLLDFVSPFTVILAVLCYFAFAAFVIFIKQHPFAGFAGYLNIGIVTLIYVLNASVVYAVLYGKKPNPFETHARRVHTIGLVVKSSVYSCIVIVMFLSLNFTLVLFDLQSWEPFALSVFFVACALLCLMGLTAPPRSPEEDAMGSDEQMNPGMRDLSA